MAVPSGPVAKLTPSERSQLVSWGFIRAYNRYQRELVDLAKGTYVAVCHVVHGPPTEDQFFRPYWLALQWTDLYRKKIAGRRGHLPPSLYEYYSELLAKYVLEHDWRDISSVPCP